MYKVTVFKYIITPFLFQISPPCLTLCLFFTDVCKMYQTFLQHPHLLKGIIIYLNQRLRNYSQPQERSWQIHYVAYRSVCIAPSTPISIYITPVYPTTFRYRREAGKSPRWSAELLIGAPRARHLSTWRPPCDLPTQNLRRRATVTPRRPGDPSNIS